MALPSSPLPISLAEIQTEFGGINPTGLAEYYRSGNYVSSTLTSVPSYDAISFSDFRGLSRAVQPRYWFIGPMFSIQSTGSNADDLYFGGQMAEGASEYRTSNDFVEVTAPDYTQDPIYLTVDGGWAAQLSAGYTRWRPNPWSSYRYKYDEISQPGLRVYRTDDGAYMGGVNGDTTVVTLNSSWGVRYCNETLRILVEPNKKYKVYYSVYMYRPSEIEYGDVSFGWYDSIRPNISFKT